LSKKGFTKDVGTLITTSGFDRDRRMCGTDETTQTLSVEKKAF
jgi:hypothetical protein